MKNLTHPNWIKAKGILFLLVALFSTAMLIAEHPTLRFTLLFSITVWSFCRFYYFAYYVITNYVDPTYKFAGLGSFLSYLVETKKPKRTHEG
ncbi:MAG: hypothetical protein JWO95_2552 [Verrucomicrobiales bacterium]|nr:hypothetical protein [Verrucomicrobiales bacterium]